MAILQDLTGQRFDKLVVLEKAPSRNRHTYWKCQCDCGNICEISGESLKRKTKTIKHCGCELIKNIKEKEKEERKNYLIGQTFGKLKVLERTNKSNNSGIIWLCQCECGNFKEVPTGLLTSGHTKSCGCLIREVQGVDITNQRFGKLIALYPCDYKKRSTILWHCKCDCGNECDIDGSFLRRVLTKSCGCLTQSIGELNIENILLNHNIKYKKEYSFEDLKNVNNKKLRFDFAIFDNNNQLSHLIEFDGEQHYSDKSGIWNSKDTLEEIKKRDELKNNYTKEHNIPLIRIPYWKRNNITLEMILGSTYEVWEAGQPTG